MAIFKKWIHRMNGDVTEPIPLDPTHGFHVDALLIEQYPDAIYVLDDTFQLIETNEKMKLLFENWDVVQQTDEQFRTAFDQALRGQTVHFEIDYKVDGESRKLSITNTPLYKNQLIQGVYGIIKDLSSQHETKHRYALMKVGRELLEQVPGLMVIEVNLLTKRFTFSSQVSSMLGISRHRLSQMTYDDFRDLIHPDDRKDFISAIHTLLEADEGSDFSMRLRVHHELNRQYLSVTIRGALSQDRRMLTYVIFPTEDQRRIEHELNDKDELLQRVCEVSDTAICDFSFETGQIEFATAQFQTIFGYTSSQFNAHPDYWRVVIHEEDLKNVDEANRVARQQNDVEIEYRIAIGKKPKWIRERRRHLYASDGSVRGFQSLIRDVTELREQEAEVMRLHAFDPITNIPNRETMFQTIDQLIRKDVEFVLFTVCFNRIGDINRTFGYEYGDMWRLQTSRELQVLTPDQTIVGHLDGDTILVVLPGKLSDQELYRFGERLATLSKHCFQLEPYRVYPRMQIGVSRYPNDATDAKTLIKRSYMAMGRAGKDGASIISLYASHMNIDALKRYELLRDLPKAIEAKEFYLVYQPKVNAWTGQIVGAEALMRWNHPTWGIVSPLDFIPLAEESNLFIDLTDYLIQEVFACLSRMPNRVPISLNISPKYLYHDQLLETFQDTSERYHVPLAYIEVEVAETSQLDDSQQITNVFASLRRLGVKLAFDDFGKGYSSLAYLQQFQVNTLKVDRLFGHHVADNKQARAIVQSMIVLAREFDLALVVEGIERIEDLLVLRQLGCETIQGFIFSRPLDETAFFETLHVGKILPSESGSHERHVSNRLIHAGITITTIRNQTVTVGVSPILMTSRAFNRLYFYAALRLPLDGSVHFVIRFEHGDDLPVTLKRVTEVTDGLYQYQAEYESTEIIEARLREQEVEKQLDFHATAYIDLIQEHDQRPVTDTP